MPSTEIAIRDDDGRDLELGETGELCIRGPQVMAGYWNRPDETEKVMTADGFLRTGDIARVDERGFVYIVDRKKDMINVSGFNVYPNEIEDVAMGHPGVLEAGAVGVPDARTGEAVKLVVVRKDPALTEAALIAYCRQHLTGYKTPRQVEFRDALPKTNIGKILRRELRERSARQARVNADIGHASDRTLCASPSEIWPAVSGKNPACPDLTESPRPDRRCARRAHDQRRAGTAP